MKRIHYLAKRQKVEELSIEDVIHFGLKNGVLLVPEKGLPPRCEGKISEAQSVNSILDLLKLALTRGLVIAPWEYSSLVALARSDAGTNKVYLDYVKDALERLPAVHKVSTVFLSIDDYHSFALELDYGKRYTKKLTIGGPQECFDVLLSTSRQAILRMDSQLNRFLLYLMSVQGASAYKSLNTPCHLMMSPSVKATFFGLALLDHHREYKQSDLHNICDVTELAQIIAYMSCGSTSDPEPKITKLPNALKALLNERADIIRKSRTTKIVYPSNPLLSRALESCGIFVC